MKACLGTKKHYTKKSRIPYHCSRCGRTFYADSPDMERGEPVCEVCAFDDMKKLWWEEAKHDTT